MGTAVNNAGRNFTITVNQLDYDEDGVLDSVDLCPDAAPEAIVDADGCGTEQLVPCAEPRAGGTWRNDGHYVVSVVIVTRQFLRTGLITMEQCDAII